MSFPVHVNHQSPMRRQTQLPKPVRQRVDSAHHDAAVAAARVTGRAFVAQVALQHVASLSYEEEMYANQCPHAAGRFQHIVDTFAMGAADEIRRL